MGHHMEEVDCVSCMGEAHQCAAHSQRSAATRGLPQEPLSGYDVIVCKGDIPFLYMLSRHHCRARSQSWSQQYPSFVHTKRSSVVSLDEYCEQLRAVNKCPGSASLSPQHPQQGQGGCAPPAQHSLIPRLQRVN